jgi:hypothetical protein
MITKNYLTNSSIPVNFKGYHIHKLVYNFNVQSCTNSSREMNGVIGKKYTISLHSFAGLSMRSEK